MDDRRPQASQPFDRRGALRRIYGEREHGKAQVRHAARLPLDKLLERQKARPRLRRTKGEPNTPKRAVRAPVANLFFEAKGLFVEGRHGLELPHLNSQVVESVDVHEPMLCSARPEVTVNVLRPLLLALVVLGLPAWATDAGTFPPKAESAATSLLASQAEFFSYLEWVFEVRLTAIQQRDGTALLQKAEADKHAASLGIVNEAVASWKDLANHSDGDKQALRPSVEDEYVKSLRKHTRNIPLSKWIVSVHEARAKQLSAGPPPLTQQSADAFAELLSFVAKETSPGKEPATEAPYFEAFAKALAADYKGFSEEQKISLMDMSLHWASLRGAWSTFPEDKKAKLREEWKAALGGKPAEAPLFDGKALSPALREAAKALAAKVPGWL